MRLLFVDASCGCGGVILGLLGKYIGDSRLRGIESCGVGSSFIRVPVGCGVVRLD